MEVSAIVWSLGSNLSSDFKQHLESLFDGINHFVKKVHELAENILLLLAKEQNTDIRHKLMDCRELLQKALSRANIFLKRMKKMCNFADLPAKEIEAIQNSLESGNLDGCNSFVEQIRQYIAQADDLYADFQKICKEAKEACKEGTREAEAQRTELESTGSVSKKAGYAFWGTAIAAGIGCAVATVASGGVAIPIILGATAAGTGATGAGLVASGMISTRTQAYKDEHASLRQVAKSFEEMAELARKIDTSMFECNDSLKEVKLDETNLQKNMKVRLFEMFMETLKECKTKCDEAHATLQEIDKKLAAMTIS